MDNNFLNNFVFFFKDSHHIHVWKRNVSNSDVIFVTQAMGQPLPCTSAPSCGRLCRGLGGSPAFSYMEGSCYCYNNAWAEGHVNTSAKGAQYYYKENARLIGEFDFIEYI